MVAGMQVVHVLNKIDFHFYQDQPGYIYCWMTTLPITKSQRQPPEIAPFLWEPTRHLVARWFMLGYFHSGKDNTLFSLE